MALVISFSFNLKIYFLRVSPYHFAVWACTVGKFLRVCVAEIVCDNFDWAILKFDVFSHVLTVFGSCLGRVLVVFLVMIGPCAYRVWDVFESCNYRACDFWISYLPYFGFLVTTYLSCLGCFLGCVRIGVGMFAGCVIIIFLDFIAGLPFFNVTLPLFI